MALREKEKTLLIPRNPKLQLQEADRTKRERKFLKYEIHDNNK